MQCACKVQRNSYRACSGVEKKCKTKNASIVEADEYTRKRMDESHHKNHEDLFAGKGMNSLSHCSMVRKFIPMLQAMKMPDAEAAVDKAWEKLEKIPAWQLTKVRNKKEVIAVRSRFGSKNFLFERACDFSASRAFLVLSCPSVYNPVLMFPTSSHGVC